MDTNTEGLTAEQVLATIFTQTDACIEQGGMYKYEDCVVAVFGLCFDYFHPELRSSHP